MSPLPNIRVNVKAPFPTLVEGSGFIAVVKNAGIWIIGAAYNLLAPFQGVFQPTQWEVAIYNPATGAYNTMTVQQLLATAAAVGRVQRQIASNADLPILMGDNILNVKIAAPLAITIPASSTRGGVPLTFKDVAGNWATNNLTFNRTGTDRFDGLNSIVGAVNYGRITFQPLNDGVNSGYSIDDSDLT